MGNRQSDGAENANHHGEDTQFRGDGEQQQDEEIGASAGRCGGATPPLAPAASPVGGKRVKSARGPLRALRPRRRRSRKRQLEQKQEQQQNLLRQQQQDRTDGVSDDGSATELDSDAETDVDGAKKGAQPSYWQMIKGGYNELVHAIIRPPRAEYDMEMLGPKVFRVEGSTFVRNDFELTNKRGLKLVCSHWVPRDDDTTSQRPCLIYLHGNASCRAEALEALPLVLSAGLTLFALDFAGSGKSEGKYISLGWWEREDVEIVVKHLRDSGRVSTIGLWGRSMGAVTALMFGDRDPSIACMILDSPFASLKQLAKELVDNAQLSVPRFAVGLALKMVRSSVKSRAGFDINKLNTIDSAPDCFVPALFGAAEGDEFIRPHHAQQIHDAYGGDKNIIHFEGDHNTARPQFFNASVAIWLHNTMVIPANLEPDSRSSPAERGTAQEDVVIERFHGAYNIPAPLAASTTTDGYRGVGAEGIGMGIGDSVEYDAFFRDNTDEFDFNDVNNIQELAARGFLDGDPDDYYEQAMLHHAIQMSMAVASDECDNTNAGLSASDKNVSAAVSNELDTCTRVDNEVGSGEVKLVSNNEQSAREVNPLSDDKSEDNELSTVANQVDQMQQTSARLPALSNSVHAPVAPPPGHERPAPPDPSS